MKLVTESCPEQSLVIGYIKVTVVEVSDIAIVCGLPVVSHKFH